MPARWNLKGGLVRFTQRVLIIMLVMWAQISYASPVCRTNGFEGMDLNKLRAEKFLSAVTSDVNKAEVYVEYLPSEGVLYYHSNFKTLGHRFPTKVQGNPEKNAAFSSMDEMFKNIVFDRNPGQAELQQALGALKKNVSVILDVSVFTEQGTPRVNLTGIENIRVVKDGQVLAVPVEVLNRLSIPPMPPLIAPIGREKCCLFGRPPHLVGGYSQRLRERAFDPSKVKVASFFTGEGTKAAIERSSIISKVHLRGDADALRSVADFRNIIQGLKAGDIFVLLAHREGSDYVVRSGNTEHLRISIAEVRKIVAEKEGVTFVDVGCETAQTIQEQLGGLGVTTTYDSVRALQSLERAINTATKATTYEDFLVAFSSPDLKLVVGTGFNIGSTRPKTTLVYQGFEHSLLGKAWARVAAITASFSK